MKAHTHIDVNQPNVIHKYNEGMGGVDLVDQMVGKYKPQMRKKKWRWPFWPFICSLQVVNSWRLYCMLHNKKRMPYLEYLRYHHHPSHHYHHYNH